MNFFVETPLCFGVERGELEGRLDPFYHKIEFREILQRLEKSRYPLKSYSELITSLVNGLDFRKFSETGTPYLRVSNVKENEIDTTDIKYVPLILSQIKKDVHLQTNDVLITRKGTFGLAALVQDDKEYLISSEIFRIQLSKEVSPKYFVVANNTSLTQAQLKQKAVGTIMGSLSQEALKNIIIPLPPRKIQGKIANMMEEAYRIKKEKEKKAEELLNSIDNYVLSELGIKLPELKDEQHYTLTLADIKGGRVDPAYYQPKYKNITESIEKGKYEIKKLGEVTESIVSGQRPKGGVRNAKDGIPSLGGEHIEKNGSIKKVDLKYISFDFHKKHLQSAVKPLDILIIKDGATTGKTGIVPENYPFKEANINEHLFRMQMPKKIEPYYLFSFLHSKVGQGQIKREISGGTIMGIVRESIKNLLIPLPPLSIQQKIANEVKSRREEAKTLTKEAKQVIMKTKKEVERMIIQ